MNNRTTQINNMRREGKSFREIGETLGLSKQRVHRIYVEATGTKVTKTYSQKKEQIAEMKDQIIKEIKNGKSIDSLAKKYNMDRYSFLKTIKKLSGEDINVRQIKTKQTHERNKEILADRERGMSMKQLSIKYGLKENTLSNTLAKARRERKNE